MASTLPQTRTSTDSTASAAQRSRTLQKRLFANRAAVRCLSLVLFFGIWQVLCIIGFDFFINFQLVPSPVEVLDATVDFFTSEPGVHIRSSIYRVLIGFCVASVLGTVLGLFIGWFQIVEDLMMPWLELLRPIPAVAWIPLAILMFPTAETGMIYITFVGAFFPVLISTIRAVENILHDIVLIRVGQSLGAN